MGTTLRRGRMWGMFSAILCFSIILSACGIKSAGQSTGGSESGTTQTTKTANQQEENKVENEKDLKGKRIALVMELNTGTFSQQYAEGVKEEVERFGGELTVFVAERDKSKMATYVNMAVNQNFDGILTDHGTPEALTKGIKKAQENKIPVVAFDALLDIPGVTVLEQGDEKMAELTLEQLAADAGGKGNIVKIWVAGFAPMERRQTAYAAFQQKYPDIKEIAAFGAASSSTALDTQAKMEAILKQYPNKGDITAVWAAWDEFAKGASRAIKQAGRDEIKVYGIDMSDEDLQMLQDQSSPWIATAAVDPKDIGRVQVRYLYQKLYGEQTEDRVVLEPVFVKRDDLPKDKQVSTNELGQYVQGWSGSKQGEKEWMKSFPYK
ncbi:sugar ABC transporter substrate-binding protein [Paenibacillus arenosi]|uniref:Sugar ABC transporter substrate-binding protein n=1 Tax=Paenibacillus arenosi TaxID=2774142 RepID=A0ABR9AXE9_9BACL|nr:sugar ABC transporter substrate-binding protein [Paenibacillus arenosi]MBD8497631.1 sugar ABC transporter substrate-binding protein [Paenibacillus arenosi]